MAAVPRVETDSGDRNMFLRVTCPSHGTATLALQGLAPVLPQEKGEHEGRMKHPLQYLGGFDLVSTAAAPP